MSAHFHAAARAGYRFPFALVFGVLGALVAAVSAQTVTLNPVSIASNNPGDPSAARVGDLVTVSLSASAAIQQPVVTIAKAAATVTGGKGNQWTASWKLTSETMDGVLPFRIEYSDLAGNAATPVQATTDGSTVTKNKLKQAITIEFPLDREKLNNPLTVRYTLGEAAAAGSVKLTFNNVVLTVPSSGETAGSHTVTFTPAELAGGTGPLIDRQYALQLSYQDSAENTVRSKQIYVLIDTTPPRFTAAGFIQPENGWAHDSTEIGLSFLASEDLQGFTISIASEASVFVTQHIGTFETYVGSAFPEGAVTFSLTLTDQAGNVSAPLTENNLSRRVIVDRTAPMLTVPADFTVEATEPGGAKVEFTATATDNFDPAPVVTTIPGSGSVFPISFGHDVRATATDGARNTVTKSFHIKVQDTTPPTAKVLPTIVVTADATGRAVIGDLRANVTRSDAVSLPTVTQTPQADTVFTVGSYPISFLVKDAAGNSVTVDSTVQVAFAPVEKPTATPSRAKTGAAVPGAGNGDVPAGATFAGFSAPALSDARQMVAQVKMLAGRKTVTGIYEENGAGTGTIRAIQNGHASDAEGRPLSDATFSSFLEPATAPEGAIAFVGKLQGAGAKMGEVGVWSDVFTPTKYLATGEVVSAAELRLMLRAGAAVPGFASGEKLKTVTSISLRDGQLLASLTLAPAKDVVSVRNDAALLLLTAPGAGTVLLREGTELTSAPGSTIQSFAVLQPALGSPGQGRWHAAIAVLARVSLASGEVQWVQIAPTGVVTKLLSTKDLPATAIADFDPAAKWKSFGFPAMGSAGGEFTGLATLAPKAGTTTAKDDVALLSSRDGVDWEVVAREGGPTPNAEQRYATFFDPVVNDAGQIAFLATLQSPGASPKTRTGLLSGSPDQLGLVAQLGDAAPDAKGEPTLAKWSKFISYALPSGAGADLVFLAETTGGGAAAKYKLGVWAADSTGLLRSVLRTGEPMEMNGPLLTGVTLLNAAPGAYGTSRSFNQTGAVTLLATFADRTQRLVRIDLP